MAENNQLSDETKNNSTDTSSTDASSAVIGNHENAVVPHKISNHDKLVQTMVMVDGEWINVNDTNDQANMKEDMHKVNKKVVEAQKGIVEAKNTADSAVKYADSAVSASKVNSDALVAQSSAISEAKAATDSAAAEIQQLKANTASDAANIRADVAKVESEVASAKSANQDSINALQSDIDATKNDLVGVQSGLSSAQAAIGQNQKLINDSVAKINNDIEQDRKDLAAAQQANSDTAAQLSDYAKQAADQGKTIKSLQDDGSSMKATIADINGNVSQVQDSVSGLSASLKDTQGNLATVKGLADSLNATITDHSKNISALQATAQSLSSTLSDADGRLSKVEQTATEHTSTISSLGDKLNNMKIGGRNLLIGTSETESSGKSYVFVEYKISGGLQPGTTYTLSGWARVDQTAMDNQQNVFVCAYTSDWSWSDWLNIDGSLTAKYNKITFTAPTGKNFSPVVGVYLSHPNNDPSKDSISGQGFISKLKLEEGNVATDWTPAPEDLATVTQVKQTADGIETTLKSAQGDIDQIKQTAKGTSEQLADVQGNVTNIQKDVNGLKQTTADNAGNIHTLQADSETLKDDMADAKGNISGLQKTATSLTSEMQDHAGRISRVEQTASTLTNEFSDQQGHLNRVEQTANGTQRTVANQQGQINSIQTDVSGVHQTITGQGNQIANINVTLSGLNSKYEGVSGDLGKLKNSAMQNRGTVSAPDFNSLTQAGYYTVTNTSGGKNYPVTNWGTLEVSGKDRLNQKYAGDDDSGTYTRQYNASTKSWTAWLKTANQNDVTALSNRITTNSTQITQNKQAIALKADQTTVNNLSGEVNQNKAQLEVQAGQISSKVSGIETSLADANSKINDITSNGGGRNLLRNSDVELHGKAYNFGNATLTVDHLEAGETYTMSWYGKVDANATKHKQPLQVYIYNDGWGWQTNGTIPYTANEYQRNAFTFTVPKNVTDINAVTFYLRHYNDDDSQYQHDNDSDAGIGYVKDYMLEKGTVAHDWSPAPEDTDAKITANSTAIDQTNKQISLKADQTEVDQVKQTATQNSSRLDVMANEIQSKVTSTDVDNIVNSKGYATTNTVQSLITQESGKINESITNLDAKYKAKDGVNLATKTGNVSLSGGYNSSKNIGYISLDAINDLCGKYMTVSVDVEWSGWKSGNQNRVGYELQINYDDGSAEQDGCWLTPTTANGKQRVTATYKIKDQHVQSLGEGNAYIQINCTSAKVSHLKIERGMVATPWTPAPSDNATVTQLQSVTASIDGLQSAVKNKVDQSQYTQLAGLVQTKVSQSDFNRLNNQVNVQTLDSANIDNMKTTGHYFVRNLAGNPIGGWVYVDVTGNGNDRIRQDVYQDSGTKHAFRRWFGSYWTEWSTGAEESEITQLRSDINLRVKSGDLLSQINIAAGRTLIQSNKIYFDADSFVMSPNSTAFIPSAYITDINADKINTGTLHSITINNGNGTFRVDPDGNVYANSMHVNNGSIYQGTVLGADVYSISNLTSNSLDEVNDATQDWVKLKDGIIELHGANGDHYSSIVPIDVITTYGGDGGSTDVHHGLGILDSREVIIGSASLDSEHSNRITHSRNFSVISRTHLGITNSYIQAQLDPDVEYGKGARFSIQKDNKIGAYFGSGDNGNELNVITTGTGNRIAVSTSNFDIDGEVNIKNNHGLTTENVHVTGWLGVDGSKNSIVRTSQGTVAINAYETAEYYFGDIGEGQTDSNGVAYVGIEKLFNETVNTSIPYQVFITAYGPGNVWVEQRKQDRFMVRSSQPNIKFGWEIKAKRKGYEHTRLQNVDNKLNHMEATS